jgi:hypothetical protein
VELRASRLIFAGRDQACHSAIAQAATLLSVIQKNIRQLCDGTKCILQRGATSLLKRVASFFTLTPMSSPRALGEADTSNFIDMVPVLLFVQTADAINPATQAAMANRSELDIWLQYRPTEGSLKGFRMKTQYSGLWQQGNVRDFQPEFRFIVDYTVLFRPPPQ